MIHSKRLRNSRKITFKHLDVICPQPDHCSVFPQQKPLWDSGPVRSNGCLSIAAAPGKLAFLFLSSDVIAVLGQKGLQEYTINFGINGCWKLNFKKSLTSLILLMEWLEQNMMNYTSCICKQKEVLNIYIRQQEPEHDLISIHQTI